MGRSCSVCSDPVKLRRAAELIAQQNMSDSAVARTIGVTRSALDRHRRNHFVAPVAANATDQRAERGEEIAAALNLDNIVGKAIELGDDLYDARKAAKAAGHYVVMNGIAGHEHKNLEFLAKAGGHPGFVPQKLSPGEAQVPFNLTITFPNGKTERLTTVVEARDTPDTPYAPVIDYYDEPDEAPMPDVPVERPTAESDGMILGRLFSSPKK